MFENSCFAECPAAIVEGQCTNRCPDGKYLSVNVCLDCDVKCQTCRDTATNCLRCSSGYKSYQGDCVQNCPANTLDEGTYCTPCDPTCNGCIGSSFICDRCATGYVKSGLRCIEGCLMGQYLDTSTQQC